MRKKQVIWMVFTRHGQVLSGTSQAQDCLELTLRVCHETNHSCSQHQVHVGDASRLPRPFRHAVDCRAAQSAIRCWTSRIVACPLVPVTTPPYPSSAMRRAARAHQRKAKYCLNGRGPLQTPLHVLQLANGTLWWEFSSRHELCLRGIFMTVWRQPLGAGLVR